MRIYYFCILIIISLFLSSCASEGTTATQKEGKYMFFSLSVKGELKGNVYYCILLNSEGNKIQVDDIATFTDVIRYHHPSDSSPAGFVWYHKTNPSDNVLTYITELDIYASISEDKKTITYTFPLDDRSLPFNNYLPELFSAQCLVANTNGGEIGQYIDAMGPNLSASTVYTVVAEKTKGPVTAYLPAGYPNDGVGDYEPSTIPAGMPPENADITSFRIYTY